MTTRQPNDTQTTADPAYTGTRFGLLNEAPRQWTDETIRKTLAVYDTIGGEEVRVMLDVELTDADFPHDHE